MNYFARAVGALVIVFYVGGCDSAGIPDDAPTVSFVTDIAQVSEGETASLLLEIDEVYGEDVSIEFTVDGTAVGDDVTVSSSPIVLTSGSTNAAITISFEDDDEFEEVESVVVSLSSSNVFIGEPASVTVTVIDND